MEMSMKQRKARGSFILALLTIILTTTVTSGAAGRDSRRRGCLVVAALPGCGGNLVAWAGGAVMAGNNLLHSGLTAFHPKSGPIVTDQIQTDGSYCVRTDTPPYSLRQRKNVWTVTPIFFAAVAVVPP